MVQQRAALRGLPWGRLTAPRCDWASASVAALSGLTALAFIGVAWTRWYNLESTAYDAAVFDQVLWNTAHGRWFQTSILPFNYNGEHFQPILLVFVPAYRLGANGLFLSVVQALVVAAAAVPLYLASRRFGLQAGLAAVIAACFLGSAYLHRAVNFDFHPETMVALPVFLAAWAVAGRRPWLAVAAGLSTLAFKEDTVFVALALAAVLGWHGYPRHGVALAVVAVAWTALVLLVLMPDARGGLPSGQVSRYAWIVPGDVQSSRDLLVGVLLRPWVVVQHLLEPSRLRDMALFALLTAPLALWRPAWLLILVPGLALAVLSTHDSQRELDLHYTAELVPLALLAAVFGARAAQGRLSAGKLGGIMVLPAVIGFLWLSPFSPATSSPAEFPDASARHRSAAREAFAIVPNEDSVSAQSSLLPHLAKRKVAHEFPSKATSSDWVVVDRDGPLSSQSLPWFWTTLAEVRRTYEPVFAADGVEVFRRRQ